MAFYGSDIAQTESGQQLLSQIGVWTGAEAGNQNIIADVRREVVFVQSTLYDLDQLTADLFGNDAIGRVIDVVVLDQYANGFEQIDAALAQYQNLDAIHFVTHGADGFIQLGGSWLTAHNVNDHLERLARWGLSLTEDGDILIYGCDVAASDFGRGLVDTIATATGADVAASSDQTGDLSRGGNWDFEYVGVQALAAQEQFALAQAESPKGCTPTPCCAARNCDWAVGHREAAWSAEVIALHSRRKHLLLYHRRRLRKLATMECLFCRPAHGGSSPTLTTTLL